MDTTPGTAPLVLLTTDDPERCAEALLHLLPTLPPEWPLAVVAHGTAALECQEVAKEMLRRVSLGSVGVCTGNRLDAVNEGLRYLLDAPALYVLDDDARVVNGWAHGLGQCLAPATVHGLGVRVLEGYTGVGIVAPCTDQTSNRAQRLTLDEHDAVMGLASYGAARLEHFAGKASAADVVDGFCLLLTRPLVDACGPPDSSKKRALLDPALGAWAWADLCLRAADAGYRIAVSEGVYVGRTTQVPLGHEYVGSVEDRLAFYRQHERGAKADEHLVATIIVPSARWHVLRSLRMCVRRLAPIVDAVVILLREDLTKLAEDPEYVRWRREETQEQTDQRLTSYVMGRNQLKDAGDALAYWLSAAITDVPHRRVLAAGFGVGVARRFANPRGIRCVLNAAQMESHEQRTAAQEIAISMGATAILALDYDEMLDAGLNRAFVERLLSHPNPLARAYDCGVAYHWDAPTLVREDPPWGHGGQYTGGQHGARLLRLRPGDRPLQVLPGRGAGYIAEVGPACLRAAAMTMRRFRFARPADRAKYPAQIGHEEGMRLSTYNGSNRMGLHMLLYEKEQPEDVARWLDDVHALVDRVVLVWTGEWAEADKLWTRTVTIHEPWVSTGPPKLLADIARMYGCEWVHEPLADDIAQARNAGISALHEHGLRWAWFVDPDEWLPDPLANGVALRNMAGSSRWGWLMQVANYRADGAAPTISDSVRISYLDPDGIMRMDGRVHEGFQRAIHTLQAREIHPRLVYAPFVLQHRGMAFDAERMDAKLVQYEHLLRLELGDNPHSPGAWVSLGWQYMNDGHEAEGLECYRRAIACAGKSYLPFKEMAYHHLRQARALLEQCEARLVDGHQFHALAQRMHQWLQQYAPPHPVIPRLEDREPAALPDWTPPATQGASGYDVA